MKKEIKNHHDHYHLQGVIHHFCSSVVSCSTSAWLQQIQLGSWPQPWRIMCFWWSVFKHGETELVIHVAGSLQQKHNSSAVEYFFQNLSTECKYRQMKGLKQAADNAGRFRAYYIIINTRMKIQTWATWLLSRQQCCDDQHRISKCESDSFLPRLIMP